MTQLNPFATPWLGETVETVDAAGRIEQVRRFSFAQCRAALSLPHLQKTVQTAIHRRLRQLEKTQ